MPGVLRIALIGSLTTDEPDPKDADVLVTVADEADLAPLAGLGRKLQGHAQSFNRGGEVFRPARVAAIWGAPAPGSNVARASAPVATRCIVAAVFICTTTWRRFTCPGI